MILALLWPVLMGFLVVLAIPFLVFLAPPLWAARCTLIGGAGGQAAVGAFMLTLVYTWLVWTHVTGTAWLIVLLVGVPWAIGRMVMMTDEPKPRRHRTLGQVRRERRTARAWRDYKHGKLQVPRGTLGRDRDARKARRRA